MPVLMGIDIETYSSAPLPKCGVYRYCDAPDFGILLFSYAFDDDPVKTIDLTSGETLPLEVISAMEDPSIIKVAYNAQFERVCLSRYLGHWLDPHQWRCTMVMAAYLTLPGRLADAAVALGTTEKKMEEGKDLIRYFSVPCKPTKTNGGRTRNLPADAPEKWAVYRQYNAQDVEVERAIRKALEKYHCLNRNGNCTRWISRSTTGACAWIRSSSKKPSRSMRYLRKQPISGQRN